MNRKVSPVPDDFRTITPHLIVRGVAKADDFYRAAFGAEELYRNMAPDGRSIMHCEMLLGDSRYFHVDANPDWGCLSPLALNGSPITLHLYVPDVDAFSKRATDAGATVLMPVQD